VWLQNIDEVVTPSTSSQDRNYISGRCAVALYAAILFTRGYGFTNDTQQIRVVTDINDQAIGTCRPNRFHRISLAVVDPK